MSDYELWLLHPAQGYPLACVSDFESLEYAKVTNGLGAFTLTLPSSFDITLAQQDARLVVYRKPTGGAKQIDFVGFVEYRQRKTENDTERWVVAGYDLNSLLDRRIVAYAAGEAQSEKTDFADDMLKAIVRENLGSLATNTDRDLTAAGLTVQTDTSQGTSLTKAFSWRNVLLVMQEIADASHDTEATSVYFGIVPLGTGFDCEFQTNILQWGNDHRYQAGSSGAVMFALELGNVANAERSIEWRGERNFAYGGGQGEGLLRDIQTASDATRIAASPFNRREVFADARNDADSNAVLAVAQAAVRDGRPKNFFSGNITNIGSYVYGRDYQHGDYVTAVYAGEQIDCRIDTVNVKVNGEGEEISFTLRSES